MKPFGPGFLAGLCLGLAVFGCTARLQASAETGPETVARIHWQGKKRLAAEPSAGYLMGIWNLPESKRLESQTLEKLANAPWRLRAGATNSTVTNAASALLLPVMRDLIDEESYLEIQQPTKGRGALALAIRLSEAQAGVWETNLAVALESLTGHRPRSITAGARGWSLDLPDYPNRIDLTRAGDWTLVGLARGENALLASLRARVQSGGAPLAVGTNSWVDADIDLPRVGSALGLNWRLPADWPRILITLIGQGGNVRTRGELKFPRPLPIELDAWNIPTNLIQDPLTSFTAVRGTRPWLASLGLWKDPSAAVVPNQAYFWALDGGPLVMEVAAPVADVTNSVRQLTDLLVDHVNPCLNTNVLGEFQRAQNGNGATWSGVQLLSPYVQAETNKTGSFVVGGITRYFATKRPPPAELIQSVLDYTNLVYYDWELTDPRLRDWLYTGQLLRVLFRKVQWLPNSAAAAWVQAAAPKLGNCVTVVTRTGPERLTFTRQSSLGLSAPEFHLLLDWLESPTFPRGIYSLVATNAPRAPRQRKTGALPATATNVIPSARPNAGLGVAPRR